ncbi:hypothetical protein COF67_25395 [Bacillus toyonensis]|uniref:AbiTii domain-containing protein n=1 Tax=Bacillus toyonensis TaxID=155322 RepID=UPI000BFDF719|nr:hypothetical protein [Bacillus toyonensis]PHD44854.1 hypothetical protein COF67_25395 [Bacillus toyonensis]
MESIVLDLIREATNSNSDVSDLLRNSLVVAKKLKAKEFEEWVYKELHGYETFTEVPEYREIIGNLQWFNVSYGWVPAVISDERASEIVTRNKIPSPIGEIQNLLKGNSDFLIYQLMEPQQKLLGELFKSELSGLGRFGVPHFRLTFGKSQAQRIVEKVRNILFDRLLDLGGEDIMVEWSNKDKEKQEPIKQDFSVHFHGNASGIQFQQNSPNSTQTMTNGVDVGQIADLIAKIKENLNQTGLSEEQQSIVESEVETVTAELVSAQPQPTVIQKSLQSIRTMLEGAGGNVIASGLTFMIDKLPF